MSTAEGTTFAPTSYATGGIPVGVALLTWALTGAGLDVQTAGAVAAGAGSLVTAYLLRLQQRRKSQRERVRELLWGELHERPLTVALLVALLMIFFEFVTGAVVGSIVAMAGTTIGAEEEAILDAMLSVLGFVVAPVIFIVTIPLTRFAFHRIHRKQLVWVGFALALSRVFSVLVFVVFMSPEVLDLGLMAVLVTQFMMLVVMLVAASLGYLWARRTASSYRISLLFRRLLPEDRQSVIDLLREHLSEP